jgi:hypothetical protein
MSRCDEYRDLLETWVAWWNGPGRRSYHDDLLPPLTRTATALNCTVCAGVGTVEAGDQERCAACGHRFGRKP